MAEFLVKKTDSHFSESFTTAQLESDSKKLWAYLNKKPGGFYSEVEEDGWFATAANPNGHGWRGDKFCLIVVQGVTKKQAISAIENKKKVITVNGKNTDIWDSIIDVSQLKNPTYYETGSYPVRTIYKLNVLSDIKFRKADYSKALALVPGLEAISGSSKN